jgi:hypothetical protein
MYQIVFLNFILFLVIPGITSAQFSVNADISPRAELRHGYRILPGENDKVAGHVNQRTRLSLAFQKDNIRTHISFQDVRVWGQEPLLSNIPSMSIHEAWAEMMFNNNLALKIGRQQLSYDNQRFFSFNDWHPFARKHDLALLKYKSDAGELHFGTAFNQEWEAYGRNFGTQYDINAYKYMNYLWYHTPLTDSARLSLLALADGYQNPGNNEEFNIRGTWSAFFTMNINAAELVFNPAFQHGKTRLGQDIRAFYFRLEGSLGITEKIRSTLGTEFFSGNDAPDLNDDIFRAFDVPYGAGHANSGFMDYFTNYPVHTGGAGLINPYFKNRIQFDTRAFLNADLHLFFIQNDYLHNDETINKYLGTEVDLTLNYRFNDFTSIIGGFSTMFGTESMEIIKGGSKNKFAYFAYIMLRIRPKLL